MCGVEDLPELLLTAFQVALGRARLERGRGFNTRNTGHFWTCGTEGKGKVFFFFLSASSADIQSEKQRRAKLFPSYSFAWPSRKMDVNLRCFVLA